MRNSEPVNASRLHGGNPIAILPSWPVTSDAAIEPDCPAKKRAPGGQSRPEPAGAEFGQSVTPPVPFFASYIHCN
jgi:hypothetical protein